MFYALSPSNHNKNLQKREKSEYRYEFLIMCTPFQCVVRKSLLLSDNYRYYLLPILFLTTALHRNRESEKVNGSFHQLVDGEQKFDNLYTQRH